MTQPPLQLDICIDLKPEPGRHGATGQVKRAAMDLADRILDDELGRVRAWSLQDGLVAVAPLPMFRRTYAMDAWQVRVQLRQDPQRLPQVLMDMGRARAALDARHWSARLTSAILCWCLGARGRRLIEQTHGQLSADYAQSYAREVSGLAFAHIQQVLDAVLLAHQAG